MCDQIFNRDTSTEIDTVDDLRALVGDAIEAVEGEDADPNDCCLCNIDHEAVLKYAGYAWEPIEGNTTDIITYKLS
jgi:hypothetical protein